MTTTQTTTEPVVDDNIFAVADSFKKRGNWTEERHEILKNVTIEDIVADAERLEAENPEEYSTPEEIRAKLAVRKMEQAALRAAELVEA